MYLSGFEMHNWMCCVRPGRLLRWRPYPRRTRVWSGAFWSSCGLVWTCPKWCCLPSSWSHALSSTNCQTTTTTPICSHSQYLRIAVPVEAIFVLFRCPQMSSDVLWVICCVLCPRAVQEESAYGRIKQVLRWYLSGFYKKPKVNIMCITAMPWDFVLALWPRTWYWF